MNNSISIIIPVYNTSEELLVTCFDSLICQTYRFFELIIVDDGSCADTANICDSYAAKYSYIRVFHLNNGGVSAARNFGIEQAMGEYIAFIDSDDYVESNYLEILVSEMDDEVDCVVCGCEHVTDVNNVYKVKNSKIYDKKTISNEQALHSLLYMFPPYDCIEITACWGKLYRRNKIGLMSFNKNITVGEDFVFNYEYFKKSSKIKCLNLDIYKYLIHCNSVMHGKFNSSMLSAISEFDILIEREDDGVVKNGLIARTVNIALVLLGMMDLSKTKKEYYKLVCSFISKYRMKVLINKHCKLKIKGALFVSLINYSIVNAIMNKR